MKIKKYKIIVTLCLVLSVIPLYLKLTTEDYERMVFNKQTPFVYDATLLSFGVLSSASNSSSSNWGQGLAIVLSPIALIMTPSSIIADTILLPYDYYKLQNAKPVIKYWKQALSSNNNDKPDSLINYRKYYGEYGAHEIHDKLNREYLRHNPDHAIIFMRLAVSSPEYKYSEYILDIISSKRSYLPDTIVNKICELSIKNPDVYFYKIIVNHINNKKIPIGCIRKYSNLFLVKPLTNIKYHVYLLKMMRDRLLAEKDNIDIVDLIDKLNNEIDSNKQQAQANK